MLARQLDGMDKVNIQLWLEDSLTVAGPVGAEAGIVRAKLDRSMAVGT